MSLCPHILLLQPPWQGNNSIREGSPVFSNTPLSFSLRDVTDGDPVLLGRHDMPLPAYLLATLGQEEMHAIATVGAARACGGRHSEMRRK